VATGSDPGLASRKRWSSIFGDETVVARTHDREIAPGALRKSQIN
jgi:hypothetical protein